MLRRHDRWSRAGRALLAAGVAGAVTLGTIVPAASAMLPMNYDIQPGSDVLLSEVANGGKGATSQSGRYSPKNFIEITNYGDAPVDISGYRIHRCGGPGGAYGPQKVVDEGTVLQPGDQYTTAGQNYPFVDEVDSFYSTNLAGYNY